MEGTQSGIFAADRIERNLWWQPYGTLQCSAEANRKSRPPTFEAAVLRQVERVTDRRHSVAPVGLSRHALVHRLDPDLDPGAAIAQHFVQVGF